MNRYESRLEKRPFELTRSETISQIARRYLKDRNHTTTNEELRNANIELTEFASFNIKDFSRLQKGPDYSIE